MKRTIDEFLRSPYWIVDILPKQVPADSPGQYFAVEKYFLSEPRLSGIKQKHINVILKLNCYKSVSLDDETEVDPPPERIAAEMRKRYVCIMVDGAMIVSEPDDTHMTVFDPNGELLELIKAVSAGEGLFVWQP